MTQTLVEGVQQILRCIKIGSAPHWSRDRDRKTERERKREREML
jgi:hypothetical protein